MCVMPVKMDVMRFPWASAAEHPGIHGVVLDDRERGDTMEISVLRELGTRDVDAIEAKWIRPRLAVLDPRISHVFEPSRM